MRSTDMKWRTTALTLWLMILQNYTVFTKISGIVTTRKRVVDNYCEGSAENNKLEALIAGRKQNQEPQLLIQKSTNRSCSQELLYKSLLMLQLEHKSLYNYPVRLFQYPARKQ